MLEAIVNSYLKLSLSSVVSSLCKSTLAQSTVSSPISLSSWSRAYDSSLSQLQHNIHLSPKLIT